MHKHIGFAIGLFNIFLSGGLIRAGGNFALIGALIGGVGLWGAIYNRSTE